MKVKVRIKTIGNLETGNKKEGGTWAARSMVLEEDGQLYPDRFAVRLTGEGAENLQWKEGDYALATLSFTTREYNGRHLQDVYLKNLNLIIK